MSDTDSNGEKPTILIPYRAVWDSETNMGALTMMDGAFQSRPIDSGGVYMRDPVDARIAELEREVESWREQYGELDRAYRRKPYWEYAGQALLSQMRALGEDRHGPIDVETMRRHARGFARNIEEYFDTNDEPHKLDHPPGEVERLRELLKAKLDEQKAEREA